MINSIMNYNSGHDSSPDRPRRKRRQHEATKRTCAAMEAALLRASAGSKADYTRQREHTTEVPQNQLEAASHCANREHQGKDTINATTNRPERHIKGMHYCIERSGGQNDHHCKGDGHTLRDPTLEHHPQQSANCGQHYADVAGAGMQDMKSKIQCWRQMCETCV